MTKIRNYAFVLMALVLSLAGSPASAMEGYAWIDNSPDGEPHYLESDCSGTGWAWDAATETLTLDSACNSYIFIHCQGSTVNINVNDDVTLNSGDHGSAICVNGSLNIYGSGTLPLIPSARAADYSIPTIQAFDDITFSGATVIVSGDRVLNRTVAANNGKVTFMGDARVIAYANGEFGYAIYADPLSLAFGSTAEQAILLEGNAQVQAGGYGANGAGLIAESSNVAVNDNARLTARGQGGGYALEVVNGYLFVNNDNVVLKADDKEHTCNVNNSGSGEIKTDTKNPTNEDNMRGGDGDRDSYSYSYNGNGGGGGGCDAAFGLGGVILAIPLTFRRKRQAE